MARNFCWCNTCRPDETTELADSLLLVPSQYVDVFVNGSGFKLCVVGKGCEGDSVIVAQAAYRASRAGPRVEQEGLRGMEERPYVVGRWVP